MVIKTVILCTNLVRWTSTSCMVSFTVSSVTKSMHYTGYSLICSSYLTSLLSCISSTQKQLDLQTSSVQSTTLDGQGPWHKWRRPDVNHHSQNWRAKVRKTKTFKKTLIKIYLTFTERLKGKSQLKKKLTKSRCHLELGCYIYKIIIA